MTRISCLSMFNVVVPTDAVSGLDAMSTIPIGNDQVLARANMGEMCSLRARFKQ